MREQYLTVDDDDTVVIILLGGRSHGDCGLVVFFFFQAEDGIRDLTVTGVVLFRSLVLLPAGDARSSRRGGEAPGRDRQSAAPCKRARSRPARGARRGWKAASELGFRRTGRAR